MTDRNETLRPNMNDRSEREFMGRMESNHAKLTEFSQTVESFTQDYQRLYATYISYRDMLREVLAERDQLRAEVERLRAELALRPWRPISPARIAALWAEACKPERPTHEMVKAFVRLIEADHGIDAAAKDKP